MQRIIFLARWLRDRDLQRETTAALNVVENYNGVNDYIRFGKSGQPPPRAGPGPTASTLPSAAPSAGPAVPGARHGPAG